MRNNLDSYGTFEKYLDEAAKGPFLKEIGETVDWLYGEGENASKVEYKTRIEKFKAIGEPVRTRHFYYSELEVYYSQYEELIKTVLSRAEVTEHITPEQ